MSELGKVASLASLYAGTIGYLYLSGYWGRFNVNFLEFATLTDLVRLSVMPVVRAVIAIAVAYAVLGFIFYKPVDPIPRSASRALTAKEMLIAFAIVIAFSAAFVWYIYVKDAPTFWFYLSSVIAVSGSIRLREDNITLFPGLSQLGERLLTGLLLAIPFVAYGTGASTAKRIQECDCPNGLDTVLWDAGTRPLRGRTYLGTLGEFALFWTDQNTVLIAQWDDIAPLELRKAAQEPDEQENSPR